MPVGRVQLELAVTDGAAARDGQRLDRPEREWTVALDQQVFVEGAKLALSFAWRGPKALGGALGTAERDAGEGEPPEHVVPVAVRGKQSAGSGKPGLLDERRQGVQLVGKHGRVDHEGLCARLAVLDLLPHSAANDHAVDLQNSTGDDEYVCVQGEGPHRLR